MFFDCFLHLNQNGRLIQLLLAPSLHVYSLQKYFIKISLQNVQWRIVNFNRAHAKTSARFSFFPQTPTHWSFYRVRNLRFVHIIVIKTFMKFSMKNPWQEFVQPIKLGSCALSTRRYGVEFIFDNVLNVVREGQKLYHMRKWFQGHFFGKCTWRSKNTLYVNKASVLSAHKVRHSWKPIPLCDGFRIGCII